VIIDEEVHLKHYGIIRRSGRYPWGSHNNVPGSISEGEADKIFGAVNRTRRNKSFLDIVGELKSHGLSDSQIADGLNLSTTELRARKSLEINVIVLR
jgi:hypothetical protein